MSQFGGSGDSFRLFLGGNSGDWLGDTPVTSQGHSDRGEGRQGCQRRKVDYYG